MDPDPDPGGPKTYGSDGSGSATLPVNVAVLWVRDILLRIQTADPYHWHMDPDPALFASAFQDFKCLIRGVWIWICCKLYWIRIMLSDCWQACVARWSGWRGTAGCSRWPVWPSPWADSPPAPKVPCFQVFNDHKGKIYGWKNSRKPSSISKCDATIWPSGRIQIPKPDPIRIHNTVFLFKKGPIRRSVLFKSIVSRDGYLFGRTFKIYSVLLVNSWVVSKTFKLHIVVIFNFDFYLLHRGRPRLQHQRFHVCAGQRCGSGFSGVLESVSGYGFTIRIQIRIQDSKNGPEK